MPASAAIISVTSGAEVQGRANQRAGASNGALHRLTPADPAIQPRGTLREAGRRGAGVACGRVGGGEGGTGVISVTGVV